MWEEFSFSLASASESDSSAEYAPPRFKHKTPAEQVVARQPVISISITIQHPFNRAGGRTSNVGQETQAMRSIAKCLLKTLFALVLLAIPMSIAWDSTFPGKIYYCTDDIGLDYLIPGSWVHGEIEYVDDVSAAMSRSMSEPDVLLRGWSVGRLWLFWSAMFGSSLVVALFIARLRWCAAAPSEEKQSANKPCVATGDTASRRSGA